MARKIKVEFEFDAKDVAAMIESSRSETAPLKQAELDKLAAGGALRAADYLSAKEIGSVTGMVAKLKYVDLKQNQPLVAKAKLVKLQIPQVQKMAFVKQTVMFKAEKVMNPAVVVGAGNPLTAKRKK